MIIFIYLAAFLGLSLNGANGNLKLVKGFKKTVNEVFIVK